MSYHRGWNKLKLSTWFSSIPLTWIPLCHRHLLEILRLQIERGRSDAIIAHLQSKGTETLLAVNIDLQVLSAHFGRWSASDTPVRSLNFFQRISTFESTWFCSLSLFHPWHSSFILLLGCHDVYSGDLWKFPISNTIASSGSISKALRYRVPLMNKVGVDHSAAYSTFDIFD